MGGALGHRPRQGLERTLLHGLSGYARGASDAAKPSLAAGSVREARQEARGAAEAIDGAAVEASDGAAANGAAAVAPATGAVACKAAAADAAAPVAVEEATAPGSSDEPRPPGDGTSVGANDARCGARGMGGVGDVGGVGGESVVILGGGRSVGIDGEADAADRAGQLCCGLVRVTLDVSGFVKRWQKTGEIFEEVPLRMPHYAYDTRACWIDMPGTTTAALAAHGLPLDAGLHALAHAMLAMLPLHLSCDPSDLGCECDALRHRQLWPKRLLLFDKREGGLGIADRAAAVLTPLLRDALDLMRSCDCREGCYCCVHSSKCTEYNAGVDKRAALALARHLLAATATTPPRPGGRSPVAACGTCDDEPSALGREAVAPADAVDTEDGDQEEEMAATDLGQEDHAPLEEEPPSMLGRSIAIMRNLGKGGRPGARGRPPRVAGGMGSRLPS